MERTKGWCIWWVKDSFITDAMTQLDKAGVDMTKVKLTHTKKESSAQTMIVYKNEWI